MRQGLRMLRNILGVDFDVPATTYTTRLAYVLRVQLCSGDTTPRTHLARAVENDVLILVKLVELVLEPVHVVE